MTASVADARAEAARIVGGLGVVGAAHLDARPAARLAEA